MQSGTGLAASPGYAPDMKSMMQVTRTRAIQVYLTAVAVVAVAGVLIGPTMAIGTALLALALLLAPAMVAYRVWPDSPVETAMDVMRRR